MPSGAGLAPGERIQQAECTATVHCVGALSQPGAGSARQPVEWQFGGLFHLLHDET